MRPSQSHPSQPSLTVRPNDVVVVVVTFDSALGPANDPSVVVHVLRRAEHGQVPLPQRLGHRLRSGGLCLSHLVSEAGGNGAGITIQPNAHHIMPNQGKNNYILCIYTRIRYSQASLGNASSLCKRKLGPDAGIRMPFSPRS